MTGLSASISGWSPVINGTLLIMGQGAANNFATGFAPNVGGTMSGLNASISGWGPVINGTMFVIGQGAGNNFNSGFHPSAAAGMSSLNASISGWGRTINDNMRAHGRSASDAFVYSFRPDPGVALRTLMGAVRSAMQTLVSTITGAGRAMVGATQVSMAQLLLVIRTSMVQMLTTVRVAMSNLALAMRLGGTTATNAYRVAFRPDQPTQQMTQRMLQLVNGIVSPMANAGRTAGSLYTSHLTGQLSAGTSRVTSIVNEYAKRLAGGLNTILSAIGKPTIRLADGGIVLARAADGGITSYAQGGIAEIERYANGGRRERHVAQIARPGAWRLWAEPETGGEAYIPLARRKRRRSRAVAEETVGRLGGSIMWFRNGGVVRQFLAGAVTGPTQGLHPIFLQRVQNWAQALGRHFHITSGYRSIAQQQVLYQKYLSGQGNLAARPGSSMHNFGLAIDGPHWGAYNPGSYGLVYRVRGEPWHVEPHEARQWAGKGEWGDTMMFAPLPAPPDVGKGWVNETAQTVMQHVFDRASEWAAEAITTVAGSAPPPVGGGVHPPNVERWRPLVLQALRMTNQAATWADAILNRIRFESGGDPNAVNRWDVNWRRGDPSGGLMQNIGSAYASRVAAFPQLRGTNFLHPLGSLVAAIVYTLQRYGSLSIHANPRQGYAHGAVVVPKATRPVVQPRTFDTGGTLAPGWNVVRNATGSPERLVPVATGASSGGGGGNSFTFNVDSVNFTGVTDERQAQRMGEAWGAGVSRTINRRRLRSEARFAGGVA